MRNKVVSLEHDDNEVLARLRNLSTSLRSANERVAAAKGRLSALDEAASRGQVVVRSRDASILANLEQRASQIREELQDLERKFTPDYMAKDPNIVAQRTRLAELERQIAVERAANQQAALAEARQELLSAQAAQAATENEMSLGRQEAAQFTANFNEYKSRQQELADLESAYRSAVQRRAALEANERTRMLTAKILESATIPTEPWRPLYWRDTAFSLGGSILLALLAMWVVDLFNRPDVQPAVVLIHPTAGAPPRDVASALDPGPPIVSLEIPKHTLLPRHVAFPRELRDGEVRALLRAADHRSLLPMLFLLSGVRLDEAINLRWSDVDFVNSRIHVGDEPRRDVDMTVALSEALAARPRAAESELVLYQPGVPVTRDAVEAQITCAALDAGIEDATQVNSDCLWHTYVAYLVRQGVRFSHLMRLVGDLSAEVVRNYSALSPGGSRAEERKVDVLLPALRDWSAGSST